MAKPSLVSQLPQDIQKELDTKLITNGFSDYLGLAEWLADKGFTISPSSIHRYGKDFKSKVDNIKLLTSQAKVIVENAGDEDNAVGEALSTLAQSKLFELLLKIDLDSQLEDDSDEQNRSQDKKKLEFLNLVKAVSQLNRSSVSLKKFRDEMREKAKKALAIIKNEVRNKGGISDQTIHDVEVILGIADGS
ncbi:DUF3486 family protein [Anabaena lutea]|uniref:DUF3486 family protein n=1 Tax=Anabaena lutea FACHB-196 TaxID=2692881 RepID=A0ABR8FLI7_9NOST|nr:DUF3486 family protein [Anabaena lutea]MBD2570037.1 DUF3486 family protein [Anabaena lutea FACHB-196]